MFNDHSGGDFSSVSASLIGIPLYFHVIAKHGRYGDVDIRCEMLVSVAWRQDVIYACRAWQSLCFLPGE
jgi:hypothetical protein